MAAFATSTEFLERIDDQFVEQLVTSPAGTVDEPRVTRALEDASAELEGWLQRIPGRLRPAAGTLRVHAIKVALYLLTLDRPAADFESIRNAYTDTIAFYRNVIADVAAGGAAGSSASPGKGRAERPSPSAFNDSSLKRYV